jgi:hypothetical protein
MGLSVYDRTKNKGKWLEGLLDGHYDAWNAPTGHIDMIVECALYPERNKTWHVEKSHRCSLN